ncbi:MAG: helix-turn-helix domain-containing protein, partial [Geminicoccaceae bacterium]
MMIMNPTAAWLHETGTKPADLAKRMGVARSTVLRWRAGTIPQGGVLFRLRDKCGIDYEEWLRNKEADTA